MTKFLFIISLVGAVLATTANAGAIAAANVTQVASGVYVAEGNVELANGANLGTIANRGFIIGDEAVAVIDSGGSLASGIGLKAAIRMVTALPIRYVINTHMHPDHVLGNAAFRDEGAMFVGHAKLPRALAARAGQYLQANRALIGEAGFAGTEIVPPTLLVEGAMTLDLGNRVLQLTAHPTAHTDNDLTVFDERSGMLFLGDLLFAEHLPALDGSLNGWLGVLGDLAALPAARAVPGHGPASLPWPEGAAPERAYLTALRDDLRRAVKSGWPLAKAIDAIAPHDAEQWRLVEDFHKRNIAAAFGEMEWE